MKKKHASIPQLKIMDLRTKALYFMWTRLDDMRRANPTWNPTNDELHEKAIMTLFKEQPFKNTKQFTPRALKQWLQEADASGACERFSSHFGTTFDDCGMYTVPVKELRNSIVISALTHWNHDHYVTFKFCQEEATVQVEHDGPFYMATPNFVYWVLQTFFAEFYGILPFGCPSMVEYIPRVSMDIVTLSPTGKKHILPNLN